MKRAGAPANAVYDPQDKQSCADSCETRTGFCMTCQSNVRVRLPKLPVAKKRPRSSTPATKTTAPIDDGDIGCAPTTKRSKKAPSEPCQKVLTPQQIVNLRVKVVELLCRSKSERETWARPLGKRFGGPEMAKIKFKELLAYSLGKGRPVPRDLALRLFEFYRGPTKKKTA